MANPPTQFYDVNSGLPINFTSTQEAEQAYLEGKVAPEKGLRVNISKVDPKTGKSIIANIESTELHTALGKGYSLATPDQEYVEQKVMEAGEHPYKSALDVGQRKFFDEASFGVVPRVMDYMYPLTDAGKEAEKRIEEEHPVASGVGTVGGFVGSLVAGEGILQGIGAIGKGAKALVGLGKAAKTGEAAAVSAKAAVKASQYGTDYGLELAKAGGRALGSGVKTGLEFGAFTAVPEGIKAGFDYQDNQAHLGEHLSSVILNAGLGAGLGVGGSIAKSTLSALGSLGKSAIVESERAIKGAAKALVPEETQALKAAEAAGIHLEPKEAQKKLDLLKYLGEPEGDLSIGDYTKKLKLQYGRTLMGDEAKGIESLVPGVTELKSSYQGRLKIAEYEASTQIKPIIEKIEGLTEETRSTLGHNFPTAIEENTEISNLAKKYISELKPEELSNPKVMKKVENYYKSLDSYISDLNNKARPILEKGIKGNSDDYRLTFNKLFDMRTNAQDKDIINIIDRVIDDKAFNNLVYLKRNGDVVPSINKILPQVIRDYDQAAIRLNAIKKAEVSVVSKKMIGGTGEKMTPEIGVPHMSGAGGIMALAAGHPIMGAIGIAGYLASKYSNIVGNLSSRQATRFMQDARLLKTIIEPAKKAGNFLLPELKIITLNTFMKNKETLLNTYSNIENEILHPENPHIEESLKAIKEVDPDTYNYMVKDLQNKANLLIQAMPKSPNPAKPFIKDTWTPSQKEINEFNRKVELTKNPSLLIQLALNGTITPADVNFVKATSPNDYNKLVGMVNDLAQHPKANLMSRQHRAAVGTLIGDHTLDSHRLYTNFYQSTYAYEQKEKQREANQLGGKGNTSSLSPRIHITVPGGSYQTPLQSTLMPRDSSRKKR